MTRVIERELLLLGADRLEHLEHQHEQVAAVRAARQRSDQHAAGLDRRVGVRPLAGEALGPGQRLVGVEHLEGVHGRRADGAALVEQWPERDRKRCDRPSRRLTHEGRHVRGRGRRGPAVTVGQHHEVKRVALAQVAAVDQSLRAAGGDVVEGADREFATPGVTLGILDLEGVAQTGRPVLREHRLESRAQRLQLDVGAALAQHTLEPAFAERIDQVGIHHRLAEHHGPALLETQADADRPVVYPHVNGRVAPGRRDACAGRW